LEAALVDVPTNQQVCQHREGSGNSPFFHSPQQSFDEVCLALKKTLLRRIASSEAAPARAAANSDHDELPLICGQ